MTSAADLCVNVDDPEDEWALLCANCGQRVEYLRVIIYERGTGRRIWDRRRYDLRTSTRHLCPGTSGIDQRQPSPFSGR